MFKFNRSRVDNGSIKTVVLKSEIVGRGLLLVNTNKHYILFIQAKIYSLYSLRYMHVVFIRYCTILKDVRYYRTIYGHLKSQIVKVCIFLHKSRFFPFKPAYQRVNLHDKFYQVHVLAYLVIIHQVIYCDQLSFGVHRSPSTIY